MKVICINAGRIKNSTGTELIEGKIYTAIGECIGRTGEP